MEKYVVTAYDKDERRRVNISAKPNTKQKARELKKFFETEENRKLWFWLTTFRIEKRI